MEPSEYFKQVGNSIIFTGDKLVIYISERYKQHGCLEVTDTIKTVGIFDMIINDTIEKGYLLPARFTIEPSYIESEQFNNNQCVKLTLFKNDIFIKNINIIKEGFIGYFIFYEFPFLCKKPKFVTYDIDASIFDSVKALCGVNFKSNRVVFELISSHLYRSQHDISLPYRLTDMTEEPINISMRDVTHASLSTSSKLIGSYFPAAINASLVNQSDESSQVEDLLRI